MRTHTAPKRTAIAADRRTVHVKAEVESADGVMVDWSDWYARADWRDSADAPNWEGTIAFVREDGALSLAPAMESSPLNISGGVYKPAISGGRRIRLSTAVVTPGVAPVVGDYDEVFDGYIVEPESGGGDENLVSCAVRDKYGLLMRQQTSFGYQYGTLAGIPMEDAMQAILDDHPNAKLGPVTLWLPFGSPGVNQTLKTLPVGPVLLALRNIADQIGWTVKPKYDSTGALRLAFYPPERAKTVADFSLGPGEYFDISSYAVPTDDVRNQIEIGFIDRATGLPDSYYTEDAASIAEFGPSYMRIEEDNTSNIDTMAEATLMGDAAKLDLRNPYANQRVTTPYLWIAEVGDLIEFPPNAVIYDTIRKLAVVELHHSLERDTWETELLTREQVVGAFYNWLLKESQSGDPNPPLMSVVSVTQVSATAADVVLRVRTSRGEFATVKLSDSPGGGTEWQLVIANGDPTPKLVASNDQIGPSDWWYDGSSYVQKLDDIALEAVVKTFLYAQATGASSGLLSPWLTIELPPYESVGPTAQGVSVNVIVPVLLVPPGAAPETVTVIGDPGFGKFSYNASPFTKIRLDGDIETAGVAGAKLVLHVLDEGTMTWAPVVPAVELEVDVAGLIRGTPADIPLGTFSTERWFAVMTEGLGVGGSVELRSVWVTFAPRALSLPPTPWVPPASCNSALIYPPNEIGAWDFCPVEDKASFLTWEAAYESAGGAYGGGRYFTDVDVDNGTPTAFTVGTDDPWNGGHHYIEEIFPPGSVRSGVKFETWQEFGSFTNDTWRNTYGAGQSPYRARARTVFRFSNGYVMHPNAYHILLSIWSNPSRFIGGFQYVQGGEELTIQTRPSAPNTQKLWLNVHNNVKIGSTGTAGAPKELGTVDSSFLFDGNAHEIRIETERFVTGSGAFGSASRRCWVWIDDVLVHDDIHYWAGSTAIEDYYMPTSAGTWESYGGPSASNGSLSVTVAAPGAAIGATSMPVEALGAGVWIPAGTVFTFSGGRTATTTSGRGAGATSIPVSALAAALNAGDVGDKAGFLTAEQRWRLLEFEAMIVGMPTVGLP